MRMVAIFSLIEEPAIRPNLGRSEDLLPGPQDNAHRLVVEYHREACHTGHVKQNPCRHLLVLRAVVPTIYSFRRN